MRGEDAEIMRWTSEAAIQEQILRAEVAEVLRGRLYEMQAQQVVAEGEEDAADRMLSRAVREAIAIERIVPVDEQKRPIKE
jgi:type III secretion system FlhB-like substrate exporter